MIEKTTVVELKLTQRKPVEESFLTRTLRQWRKLPAPITETQIRIRISCGLELKETPQGEYFTLWMTDSEAKPLTEMGINLMLVLMPFRRCLNLDVDKAGVEIVTDEGLEPVPMCG